MPCKWATYGMGLFDKFLLQRGTTNRDSFIVSCHGDSVHANAPNAFTFLQGSSTYTLQVLSALRFLRCAIVEPGQPPYAAAEFARSAS